ncbi:hypothetical protein HFMG06CAA_5393 [Mycoplasmoides gallisepticum CA06_2006.052-5-2P]|uniref:DUF308 domain-containing protein n=1 Tax=Mycoplasmoides gallisepticum WI01_2001.043-13-2P TaxID=1159201 RepID=J3YTL7_MYCGL|nr:DUF308 domain-containing protein [Mycoplasmoides gallisepticum]AFP76248.1 hypothetical protein HFMG94VAA_5346 [Mycoplasmoides gallisepticum VA94_7994-1-7P]AFP77016.1 hypothetical protein HFMG95NCA_5281 [Mycoplasmoides gallisepticum NC95_13295-2-2P]AFP77774.1 hypothetical protein HFMG96NCA_5461 [Mycoplasmoides gallisepticum NC96_1596-4-2P]AFP78540.1 hypothetical protein HFMG01NYA_5342 [Mycoplasmoides gallisepticum NY01_2001.047-5-1P]AFP79301.1 hypothetical protein HFMG01WIA_5197 [Mycoplasmoi
MSDTNKKEKTNNKHSLLNKKTKINIIVIFFVLAAVFIFLGALGFSIVGRSLRQVSNNNEIELTSTGVGLLAMGIIGVIFGLVFLISGICMCIMNYLVKVNLLKALQLEIIRETKKVKEQKLLTSSESDEHNVLKQEKIIPPKINYQPNIKLIPNQVNVPANNIKRQIFNQNIVANNNLVVNSNFNPQLKINNNKQLRLPNRFQQKPVHGFINNQKNLMVRNQKSLRNINSMNQPNMSLNNKSKFPVQINSNQVNLRSPKVQNAQNNFQNKNRNIQTLYKN